MRPRRCRYFLILRAFAGRIRGWARLEESGLEILRWAPNHTCPFLAALSGRGCRVSGLFRRGASTGPPFAPLCPRQRNRTVARGKLRGWAPRSFAGRGKPRRDTAREPFGRAASGATKTRGCEKRRGGLTLPGTWAGSGACARLMSSRALTLRRVCSMGGESGLFRLRDAPM